MIHTQVLLLRQLSPGVAPPRFQSGCPPASRCDVAAEGRGVSWLRVARSLQPRQEGGPPEDTSVLSVPGVRTPGSRVAAECTQVSFFTRVPLPDTTQPAATPVASFLQSLGPQEIRFIFFWLTKGFRASVTLSAAFTAPHAGGEPEIGDSELPSRRCDLECLPVGPHLPASLLSP